jgi:hypothetical protein
MRVRFLKWCGDRPRRLTLEFAAMKADCVSQSSLSVAPYCPRLPLASASLVRSALMVRDAPCGAPHHEAIGLSVPPHPEGERSERLEGWAAPLTSLRGTQAGLARAAATYMRNARGEPRGSPHPCLFDRARMRGPRHDEDWTASRASLTRAGLEMDATQAADSVCSPPPCGEGLGVGVAVRTR